MSSSSDAEDEARPTWFDGKVDREVWQPDDGNGEATPALIESAKGKKGGHPGWKLFMGEVPAEVTPSNPPRYCYLDDKAVWAISKHRKLSKEERHRFWPFDFTPQGRITSGQARPPRGRPAFIGGVKLASIPRTGRKTYYFCGSGSLKAAVPPEPATPKKEDAAATAGRTQEPSQTPAPSIEQSVQPVVGAQRTETPALKPSEQPAGKPTAKQPTKPAEKPVGKPSAMTKPLVKPADPPSMKPSATPSVKQSATPAKPLEKPAEKPPAKPMATIPLDKPQAQVPARTHKESSKVPSLDMSGDKSPADPDAMALVRLRQMSTMTGYSDSSSSPGPRNPSAMVRSGFDFSAYTAKSPGKTSQFQDRPNPLTSSSLGSSKRSSSPGSPLPPVKRQRSRLEPYVLPPEVTERDDEMERLRAENRRLRGLNAHQQNQLASAVVQIRQKDAMLAQAIKERDAYKFAARKYHTERLDCLDDIAQRHKADLKVIQFRKELQALVDKVVSSSAGEVVPLQETDRTLGQTPDDIERYFRENEMEQQWREFEAEAAEE
ncbi:hypothetical protein HDK64DRAFT_267089 [Phyllosticta capitalensis]